MTEASANKWRGERVLQAADDGPKAIVAATHEAIAKAADAAGDGTLEGLMTAIASLHPAKLRTIVQALEAVDGDPLAVLDTAPGANGLDAIADTLVGLIKGQTEEEQAEEKKRSAAYADASQAAIIQMAMEPLIIQLKTAITSTNGPKQHS